MNHNHRSSLGLDLWTAVAVICPLYLVAAGYLFPSANHAIEVLPMIAMLETGTFTEDFATLSYMGFGPRWAYINTIVALMRAGLSMPAAFFLLYGLALVSFVVAMLRLARLLFGDSEGRDDRRILALAFVALALSPQLPWDHELMASVAIPSAFAMGFCAWGILAAVRAKWVAAYGLFALGALFQTLVGLLPALILGPALLLYVLRHRRWWVLAAAALLMAAGLSVSVLPLLLAEKGPAASDLAMSAMEFFAFVRTPHHYVPSTADWWEWPNAIAALGGALLLLSRLSANHWVGRQRAPVAITLLFGATLVLAGYVFVELIFIETVAKLQFQRVMPFLRLGVIMIICTAALEEDRAGRRPAAVALLIVMVTPFYGIGILALALFAASGRKGSDVRPLMLVLVLLVLAVVLLPALTGKRIVFLGVLGIAPLAMAISPRLFRGKTQSLVLPLAALTLAAATAGARWSPAYVVDDATGPLAHAVRDATEPEAVVIVPPAFEFQHFALESRRNVWLNFKNMPFDDPSIDEYQRRMMRLTGIEAFGRSDNERTLVRGFRDRTEADLLDLAREEGATVLVSRASWHRFPDLEIIGEHRGWVAWKVEAR